MAILINKNTIQDPLATGRTGAQAVRFIPAPRVYVKTPDVMVSTPVQSYLNKSGGITPAGWTDLGIVKGVAKVTYDQKLSKVQTGIDKVTRSAYTSERSANIEFTLEQLDDVALETVSGMSASVITAGSVVNYQYGSVDINQMALLLVAQNKLDGKEWQFYNPNAYLQFSFDNSNDALGIKVVAELPYFIPLGATIGSVISSTIFK